MLRSQSSTSQLLLQLPKFAPAWALMTMTNLSQGNKPEALAAYNKLQEINPAMARSLSEAHRRQNPLSTLQLPN